MALTLRVTPNPDRGDSHADMASCRNRGGYRHLTSRSYLQVSHPERYLMPSSAFCAMSCNACSRG